MQLQKTSPRTSLQPKRSQLSTETKPKQHNPSVSITSFQRINTQSHATATKPKHSLTSTKKRVKEENTPSISMIEEEIGKTKKPEQTSNLPVSTRRIGIEVTKVNTPVKP